MVFQVSTFLPGRLTACFSFTTKHGSVWAGLHDNDDPQEASSSPIGTLTVRRL